MITSERSSESPPTVGKTIGEFASSLKTLGRLQGELLRVDAQECTRQIGRPTVALLIGGALGLAVAPLTLGGLGLALVEWWRFSFTGAFLVALASGLVLSGLLLAIGWSGARQSLSTLERSQSEFSRNVEWIKSAVQQKPLGRRHLSEVFGRGR